LASVLNLAIVNLVTEQSNYENGNDNIDEHYFEASRASPDHVELFIQLVDLLQVIIYHAIRVVTAENTGSDAKTARDISCEKYRSLVRPTKQLFPILMGIIAEYCEFLDKGPVKSKNVSSEYVGLAMLRKLMPDDIQLRRVLVDVSSRCIGMLFDLYAESLSFSILQKQPLVINLSSSMAEPATRQSAINSSNLVCCTSRSVFINALSREEVKYHFELLPVRRIFRLTRPFFFKFIQTDIRVRTRLLKILSGIVKVRFFCSCHFRFFVFTLNIRFYLIFLIDV
jgi:hypothetical protein